MSYEIFFGIASGALGSAFLIASGIFLSRVMRSISHSSTKVSKMEVGNAVELSGAVVPERDPIDAPHSGKKCVWLEEAVEKEMKKVGADKTKWEIIKVHRKTVPFSITDGTGKIRVDVSHAEIKPKRGLFPKNHGERIEESRIDMGDKVFAVGVVEKDDLGRKVLHINHLLVGDKRNYLSRPILISLMFVVPGIILMIIGAIFIANGAGP